MTWLGGWTFRKTVPIAGGSEAAANYPVPVTVHYGAGTAAPGHVYLNNHSLADFADLRFTAADGITALPYWVESKTDSDQALVWVRVDAIPVSPGTGQVYAYYGNPTAASASDGAATFDFFDDFSGASLDTAKWAHNGIGTVTVSEGMLTFRGLNNEVGVLEARGDQTTNDYCFRAKVRTTALTKDICQAKLGIQLTTATKRGCHVNYDRRNGQYNVHPQYANDSDGANIAAFTLNTWYIDEICYNGSKLRINHAGAGWTESTPTAVQVGHCGFSNFGYSGGYPEMQVDYCLQRPFIATEPAAGTAGEEQIANVPYLSASFTVAPLDPPLPLTVQFTDTSAVANTTIESWAWDFGDGTTSSAQHPSHTFPDESERTVTLTIAAELGTLTSVASLRIMPNDGIGRVIGGLLASAGPAIERGGLGRIVGVMQAVEPAGENYWDVPRQEDHPGRVLPGGLYADPDGNWWNRQLFEAEASGHDGKLATGRINWISADREMLGVSVPGRFIKLFDGAEAVGESYHLTQHKPWEGHVDNIYLSAETYTLTVIAGWGSTPPRHVSAVRYAEGVLIEWDPPADLGSSGLIDEYRIYRGPDLGSVTLVATVAGTERHWLDADAPSPAVYIVAAFNRIIESDPTTAVDIIDPDTEHLSLRDALSGASWTGLPYAGWLGVRAIRLAPADTFVLRQGVVRPIIPTIYPADATVQALAWSSDRPDIATVDASGLVRGVSPGRAVIYATATDGTEEYASVPVIVAPAFMTDDMREYLQALGCERVFTRAMPDALDRSITLLQGAGTAPDLALELDRPGLRVLIVAPDLGEAEETRKRVHDALHMAAPLDIGGVRYLSIEALSSGEYVEKTRRGPRYVCTLTFMIEKERTLHIVSDPVRANEIVGRSP